MLRVQTVSAAVHCSETPKSSSSHSGLVNITDSWSSDHTPLKRRKSQQRCTSPTKDVTSDYGFSSSEITLTLVPSDSNGYKRHRRDSERNLDSGVTLRYKDPKTMAPTEKVLDNVRQYFDSPKSININQLIKKQAANDDEPSDSTVLNECLEKISSEISIYPKQECEKSPQAGPSTSCKSPSSKDNIQTVIKVSPEVELITSPKSNQKLTRKSSLEASPNNVPENTTKPAGKTSDMNNNTSPRQGKERFGLRMSKAIQCLQGKKSSDSVFTPVKKAIDPMFTPIKKSLEPPYTPTSSRVLRKGALEENGFMAPQSRERLDSIDQWHDIYENDVSMQDVSSSMSLPDQMYNFEDEFQVDRPHYVLGFPNPPGENRCWVNASVHALFALPFTDSLDTMNLPECSQITKTLIAIQSLWRKKAEKHKIYTLMRRFKEDLAVLEDTYPSERQQDVSEFLMKFLNHLKADFEKLMTGDAKIQEIENVPENPQDHRKSKAALESNKRRPLVDISSVNGKLRRNSNLSEPSSSPKSQKVVERLANGTDTSKENSVGEVSKNPIDEYFLSEMMEQCVCKGCSDKRHIKVDNMMLYIELISKQNKEEPVNLQEAIFRNFAKDERTATCEKCQHEVQDVTTTFSKHPKILAVQVNRYGPTETGMRKICKSVSIPEKLVISPSLMSDGSESDEIYKPICVISHVGDGMDCGHYTSYIEHDDQWYHYNDMNVYPMTSLQVFEAAQSTAYLVFFVNVNLLEKPNTDPSKTHFN